MQLLKPDIIAENDHWIALNKPSGMLTLPDRHDGALQSLKGWVQHHYPGSMVVHRIDKDTSGIILFARHESAHQYLSQLFESRQISKTYHALVHGQPLHASGTIEAPIAPHPANNGTMMVHQKGKQAISHYRTLETFGKYSLLEFSIETGRTHQIRVHARHLGHPIVCDPLYGDGQPVLLSHFKRKVKLSKYQETETPLLQRLGLHACTLGFTDMDGTSHLLEAPYYKDMRALLQQLRKTQL